ncbi:PQQ-dependent dehydrogenase, methanol/ethanol family [Burkholderia sp. Bp8963]|uniref:PQQ-dependent dehydrogenase, methanol/ethanol family n=1 Tax=Burkholderia sp. Bp8963 TaxID=2184547 RepID=UPI0026B43E8A
MNTSRIRTVKCETASAANAGSRSPRARRLVAQRAAASAALALAILSSPTMAATSAAPRPQRATVANVDEASARANEADTREWPLHGLDFAGTRYSKLDQINTSNVADLGLAWSYELDSTRGVEATPLVVDGVMYTTAPWSVVHAVDARTGKALWTYDPKVPRRYGVRGCCDVVNRGVALYRGKVFVGAFDGRLIALDAKTGKALWSQDTIKGQRGTYTITGAPIVVKGKVIIGNGGGEYGGRGFVTAYDVDSGKRVWRWYAVPGDPSKPFEDASMKMAARTWDPKMGSANGGNVWNAMSYDPDLNLLYLGVGNGSPWSARMRDPKLGNNLFLDSIVALNPDTGKYVWHYQETPGENSDYDATASLVLADLNIEGKLRKVIMQAPKNGFFFVVDRTNGKFISAKNYVDVNWATGYDVQGHPIKTPMAQPSTAPLEVVPSPFGARNWQEMAYSPKTGLVYMPVQNVPATLSDNLNWERDSKNNNEPMSGTGWNTGEQINAAQPKGSAWGRFIAWDPVKQKEAWRQDYASPWNGGAVVTAGNLVFHGTADARLVAYDATTGKKKWEAPVGTGVVAPPVTYSIDGKQYVSIAVGWGGVYGLMLRGSDKRSPGRIYTFALGAKTAMPETVPYAMTDLLSGVKYKEADVKPGMQLYVNNCVFCHGVPGVDKGGAIPNLAYVGSGMIESLDKIVFNGPFVERGMPDFTGKLTKDDVTRIQAFIQGTADAVRQSK